MSSDNHYYDSTSWISSSYQESFEVDNDAVVVKMEVMEPCISDAFNSNSSAECDPNAERNRKRAERERNRRAALTPEERQEISEKRKAQTQQLKLKRSSYTDDAERKIRRNEKERQKYAALTPEEKQAINEKRRAQAQRLKLKRSGETDDAESKRLRNEKEKQRRDALSLEEKQAINDKRKEQRDKLIASGKTVPKKLLTPEEKKARNYKQNLSTLAKRIDETPEEREERLRKQRDNHLSFRLAMNPEQLRKHREKVRQYVANHKAKNGPDYYSNWTEERKEKFRAYQREKTKAETPEQREKRLTRLKLYQSRKREIEKIMHNEQLSKPEAEVMLQSLRPDLFSKSYLSGTKGRQLYTDQPYVPILHKNFNKVRPRRSGRPTLIKREQVLEHIAKVGDHVKVKRKRLNPVNDSSADDQPGDDGEMEMTADSANVKHQGFTLENTSTSTNDREHLASGSSSPQMSFDFPVKCELPYIPSPASPPSPEFDYEDTNDSAYIPDGDSNIPEDNPPFSVAPKPVKKSQKRISKPHTCDMCGKVYSHVQDLKSHMDSFHSDSPEQFPCPEELCSSVFQSSYLLWIHYQKTHQHNPLKITKETSESVSTPDLQCNTASTQCQFCGKTFSSGFTMIRHVRSVHPTQAGIEDASLNFFCDQCPKVFKAKCTLDDHIRRVHLGLDNKCDICGRTFQSAVKLWRHKVEQHKMTDLDPSSIPNINLQNCPYCSQHVFRRLDQHVMSTHPEKLEEFMLKGKNVEQSDDFKALKKTKRNESRRKTTQCEICNKTVTARRLKEHMSLMHSEDAKGFSCKKCSKKFFSDNLLVRHILGVHWRWLPDKELLTPKSPLDRSAYPEPHNCSYCDAPVGDYFLFKVHILSQHTREIINQFNEAVERWPELKRTQSKRKPKVKIEDDDGSRMKAKKKTIKVKKSRQIKTKSESRPSCVRRSSRKKASTQRFGREDDTGNTAVSIKVNEVSRLISEVDRQILEKYFIPQLQQIPMVILTSHKV